MILKGNVRIVGTSGIFSFSSSKFYLIILTRFTTECLISSFNNVIKCLFIMAFFDTMKTRIRSHIGAHKEGSLILQVFLKNRCHFFRFEIKLKVQILKYC